MQKLDVKFISSGRRAECLPSTEYPDGIDVDCGFREMCSVDLPYPAECCGTYLVVCPKCGSSIGYTAAGRADDPRTVTVPCRNGNNRQLRPVRRLGHGGLDAE